MKNPSQSDPSINGEAEPLLIFERERGRLFGIAYRMLGTVSEAEDVLQDAYMRWHGVPHASITNPPAYLIRLVTRLCIDALKSARRRRTEYIGPWLPEPLLHVQHDREFGDPATMHDLADDLSTAFLLMLERLTPIERAVFLLHESFDMSYAEIANVLGRSEAHCRQIARRARQHLHVDDHPRPADPQQHDQLLARFLAATQNGDVHGMIELLAHDVVLYSDGGGKVSAATRPVVGAVAVARMLASLTRKGQAGDLETRAVTINGRTGLINIFNGEVFNVTTFQIADGQIRQIFVMRNPDKIPPLG